MTEPLLCSTPSLMDRLQQSIRQATHGRIRDLHVEESQGRVIIRGQVPSYHTKQLAIEGALQLLSGEMVQPAITVG